MKKRIIAGFLALAGILLAAIHFAGAEMLIGQVGDLYNVGDSFNVNVTLTSGTSITGFFSAVINCPDTGEVEIYRSAESMQQGKQKIISFSGKFDRAIIGNLSGNCFVETRFAGDSSRSSTFDITPDVVVQANSAKSVYSPDETIYVTGTAFKENGKPMDGFVRAGIDALGLSVSRAVTKGTFNFSFDVSSQAPAGDYSISIIAYEKDNSNGDITNQGSMALGIRIKQVPKNIEIALDELSAYPKQEFYYTPVLTDQSGVSMNGEVFISIKNPSNEIVEKNLAKSGEKNSYFLAENATPGNWNIESSLNKLKTAKSFVVEEVENASFSILNGTLTIVNTGNVPYNKPVEVMIGDAKETVDVELAVGENRKFRVYAPDGSYELKVYSGNATAELGTASLTGNSIAIKDFGASGIGASFIIWLVIALLGGFAFVYGRKIIGKAHLGTAPKYEKYLGGATLKKASPPLIKTKNIPVPAPESSGYANKSGKNEECGIMFVNLRNRQELEQDSQASSMLARIAKDAKDAKAALKYDEKGFTCIFSPTKTGIENNCLHAIKTASRIEKILSDYNKRHALKIDFGIGVNLGEMIAERSNGTHAFYAVGNSVIIAKRAAEKAQKEILLSAPAHRRTSGIVRTEQLRAENLWRVKEIIDREEHKEFLDRFMRKNF